MVQCCMLSVPPAGCLYSGPGESLRRRGLPASRNRRILSHRARYARTTPWLAPLGFGQPPPVRRRVGAVRAPCRGPAGGFARRPDEPSPAAAPVHRGDRHPAGHWLRTRNRSSRSRAAAASAPHRGDPPEGLPQASAGKPLVLPRAVPVIQEEQNDNVRPAHLR